MSVAPGTIVMPCPHCRATLTFTAEQAGQSGPCAYCGQSVVVPSGGVPVPFTVQGHPSASAQNPFASHASAQAPSASHNVARPSSGGIRHGRFIGILMAVLGAILWAAAAFMLDSMGSTLRIFIAGPAMFLWGLCLLVFPGADVAFADVRDKRVEQNAWMSGAPMLHKIAWGIAGLIGIVLAVAMLF